MRVTLSFLPILVIFVTVLAVGSCERSKPCRCTQQTGCHCPLPPLQPKANTTKPAAAPQDEVASMNPPARHAHFGVRHVARLYPHDNFVQLNDQRSNHKGELLAVPEKHRDEARRPSTLSPAYNLSRRYAHARERRHEYGERYTQRDGRRSEEATQYDRDSPSSSAATAPLSINAPAALDPWH